MRRWLGLGLRVLGTAVGVLYITGVVHLETVRLAFARIPLASAAAAVALIAANVVAGAIRWRVLMRAYGAVRIPSLGRATYLYFVGFFYNNYLPGAVTGDVGRGVVARDAFDEEGATGALAVVLVERLLGLFALFALLAIGLATAGAGVDTGKLHLWTWTALFGGGSVATILAIAGARRLAPRLPRALAVHAAKLPELRDRGAFVAALGWSLATQALTAAAGWVLLAAFAPVSLTGSLLIVPLGAATMFLPITFGGVGAREGIYAWLGGSLFGIATVDAIAASLAFWFAHLAVGACGGIAQLFGRRRV